MSKFEQLLDLIVNEEHDKANELFHEIVVEKSREIYENLIAQEAENDVEEAADDVEESADDVEESADDVEEGMDDVEEAADDVEESADDVEESMDDEPEMEDAYSLEGDDEEEMPEPSGMEKTDDLEGDIGSDEEVEFDIKSAIEQLQAALDKMEGGMGGDMGDEMPDDEMPGTDGPEELKMGFAEGKRMTREYVEKVGNDWDKNSQKTQADYVGAKSGDVEGKPVEGKSPIASGSNKPGPAGVNAKNLNQSHHEGGTPTGTSPAKVNKGINPESSEKFASGIHNVDGKKSGVKTLSNVKGGHGAEKKGAGPGPVGSGTGDKAGQTSVKPVPQMLKPYSK